MSPDPLVSRYLQHLLKKCQNEPELLESIKIHQLMLHLGYSSMETTVSRCNSKKKASYHTTARETSNYECEHVAAEAAAHIAAALCTLGK